MKKVVSSLEIAGIVAEYNPFHTGHGWHVAETRRLGATHIVAVMSGCYVQRGEPALWDKWVRTRAALLGGVDLVLELPLPYAAATAQRFAFGAVSILDALGVVDRLSFGSECGDVALLSAAAEAILDSSVEQKTTQFLSEGITYAAARQQAVSALYGQEVSTLLERPNNILGIEYLAALRRLGSSIKPMTVTRMGAGHDSSAAGEHASASALRALVSGGSFAEAERYLPEQCRALYTRAWEEGACYLPALLERPMLAALRRLTVEEISALPDISEGLENRIYTALRTAESVEGLLDAVKTKRYSHARLRRILLCGFLGIPAGLTENAPPYIRILGMNDRGQEILARVGRGGAVPISHSLLRLSEAGERQNTFAQLEAVADDLYGTLTGKVQPCGRDYTNSIIKV
ncbi:MAG: nucleotidyltransferase family protein [Angelakisella sp.]